MRNAESGLDSLAEIDRRIGLMAATGGTAGIVDAVREYLALWPRERILKVQEVDGGWGPFDARQQPVLVRGPDHIIVLGETLHRHRNALKESGFTPTTEFLEIELFFSLARQVVENWKRASGAQLHQADSRGYSRRAA